MIARKGRAYKAGKRKRQTQAEKVFNWIRQATENTTQKGISTDRLVKVTGLKIHSLSARLSELEQDGKIYQKAKHGAKGVVYTVWSETPPELVELRRAENWNKRLALWIGKGLKNGFLTKNELKYIDRTGRLF